MRIIPGAAHSACPAGFLIFNYIHQSFTEAITINTPEQTAGTVIYAVRHGETEWNKKGLQQGHLDSPLTASGERQAQALAKGLTGKGIELIYCSDLGRARQTADFINAELQLEIRTDQRLRERHLGSMQTLTKPEFREQFPDEWQRFSAKNPDYELPGGESIRQRYSRTVACVEEIAARHQGQTLLVVGHGGTLNSLFIRISELPLSKTDGFSLFNCAINRFTVYEHTWHLDTWGDISHLAGMTVLDDNL